MSADVLREAAVLMRARAIACEQESPLDWQVYGTRVEDSSDMTVARCMTVADAEHIASWHPAVALAVADWLDQHAQQHGPSAGRSECIWYDHACNALAVARQYLGESA